MSIKIIKNTLKEPIYKVCEDCGSEFTFNCYDIQRGKHVSLFGNDITYRYVVCPVCKHECTFRGVKIEKALCDSSKEGESNDL